MSFANPELWKTPCFSFSELCASSAIISDGLKFLLRKNNTPKFIPGRQTSYSTYDQSIIRNILFPIIASQSLYRELSFRVFIADELTCVYYKLVAYSRGINYYSNQCCSLTTDIHPNCWIFYIFMDCIYMLMFTYCIVCKFCVNVDFCKYVQEHGHCIPLPTKTYLKIQNKIATKIALLHSVYFTHYSTPPVSSLLNYLFK